MRATASSARWVSSGATTWIQFAGFLLVGIALYLLYGRRNSRLAALTPTDAAERVPQAV